MRTLSVLFALALAGLVMADQFDTNLASIQLLTDKRVQTELKVNEAQRKKMNSHAAEFNKQAEAYRKEMEKKSDGGKKPVQPDRQREMQMLTSLKAKVLGELSQTQIKRLREISLQAVGVTALGDAEVGKRVGINETQRTQIQKLIRKGLEDANKVVADANKRAENSLKPAKTQAEVAKWQQDFQKKSMEEQRKAQPQIEKIRTQTISSVLAVMNDKQKAAWKALLGAPFKAD